MYSSLWEIVCKINPGDRESCQAIDGDLAEKIESMEDIYSIYYYIPYQRSPDLFKKTSAKIDYLAIKYLENTENQINWYKLKSIAQFFSNTTKEKMVERWLQAPDQNSARYISELIPEDKEIVLTFLEKAIDVYKTKKSYENLAIVGETFRKITPTLLQKACAVLSTSTPAITACLLSRNDIAEDFTLNGLRSLSKLKARHSVQKTIKLEIFKNLGPRGRLDAISHLTYEMLNNNFVLLDPMPTKDELQVFLFPCVLKYNDEVVRVIQEYELALNQLIRR